jgi:hypothetical protein
MKIRILNDTGQRLYLSIEPIADGYYLDPNEIVELVGRFDLERDDEVLVVMGKEDIPTISFYAPENIQVIKDGSKIGPSSEM